jgi:hypothetical protein
MAKLKELSFEDFEKIVIVVQLKNGCAHQVLSTSDNKIILLKMLSKMDGTLNLSKEIEPFILKTKKTIEFHFYKGELNGNCEECGLPEGAHEM